VRLAKKKNIVMLGTSLDSKGKGGIWSVIDIYRRKGLFDLWPIIYLPTYASGNKISKFFRIFIPLITFLYLLISNKVYLLHVHSASRASFWRKSLFILLAFAFRRPVIFHLHGAEFNHFYWDESRAFSKWFIRFILNNSASIIVLSSQWKSDLKKITTNKRIFVIFNPVETQDLKVTAYERNRFSLLFLGRFGKRKGIFDLLQAIAHLCNDYPQLKLRCAGDGNIDSVNACIAELGISQKVELLGWIGGEYKRRCLMEAGIYVLPSYNEGLPMSVLEAMGAGLPIVSTTVGGIPDAVFDGKQGFLIEPGNIIELADAIRKLLDNPDLCRAMGASAHEKILNHFSPEKIFTQISSVYNQIGASH
jgi:glycosyltransferase involved in cell wall biosynthesis